LAFSSSVFLFCCNDFYLNFSNEREALVFFFLFCLIFVTVLFSDSARDAERFDDIFFFAKTQIVTVTYIVAGD